MAETNNDLEVRKIELEEKKYLLDEKRFLQEQKKGFWSTYATQLSVAVPIVTLIIGAFLSQWAERSKHDRERNDEQLLSRRAEVNQQLAKFYYPIALRLEKDDSIYELAFPNVRMSQSSELQQLVNQHPAIAQNVRTLLLKNQSEILHILDENGALIENSFEHSNNIQELHNAIDQYERHTALFSALNEAGVSKTPWDIDRQRYGYPDSFEKLIRKRIAELNDELRELKP